MGQLASMTVAQDILEMLNIALKVCAVESSVQVMLDVIPLAQ